MITERRYCAARDLKKGMEVGSPNILLYTVVGNAKATAHGTITAEIEFVDGRREIREWFYNEATVAVRVSVS